MRSNKTVPLLCLAVLLSVGLAGCYTGEKSTTEATSSTTQSEKAAADKAAPTETSLPTQTQASAADTHPSYDYTKPVPKSDKVDDSYFSDAVIIGDSRTEGMFLYGTVSKATFLCGKGATVSNVETKANVTVNGTETTIMDALKTTKFSKVYISLGLNELGWNDPNIYITDYGNLIDEIRGIQPDAIIYIENLIPVNTDACATHKQGDYVNNQRISQYNTLLNKLAADKQAYLLNVAETFADASGELPAEDTADGIHLNAPYYQQWCDYMRTHTVNPSNYSGATKQASAAAGSSTDAKTLQTSQSNTTANG
jgi:lysophospholipase L1-like esterase